MADVRFAPKSAITNQNVIRRYVRDTASCRLKLTWNAIEMVPSHMQQPVGYWLTPCCDKLRTVR